jgi:hypothetical protein
MSGVTDASGMIAARALGQEAGKAAASVVFDHNTHPNWAAMVLLALDGVAGSPPVSDLVIEPHWLGGIWGGDPTPRSLAVNLGIDPDLNPGLMDEACTAYEQAASEKFWSEVEAFARRMVEDWT